MHAKDMTGEICTVCNIGRFYERTIYDDWDGKLTCNRCGNQVKRWQLVSANQLTTATDLLKSTKKDTDMTQEERQEISKVFQAVLEHMRTFIQEDGNLSDDSESQYICDNIFELFGNNNGWDAKAVLRDRIGNRFSIEEWLRDNVPEAAALYKNDCFEFNRQVNLYRLRWLERLVEEYKQ